MSLLQLFKYEFKGIFTNPAVILTVFVGIVFYSFLYPQPYARQVPRDLSLVVANLDNSQMSRQLERMVDATAQIRIVKRTSTIEEARKYFLEKKLAGILVIPENFYRDLLLGKRPTLSYSGDGSYFLVYGTVFEGLKWAGETLSSGIKLHRMMSTGKPESQALEELTPVSLNIRPVFNSTSAYLNYVLPPVFILILHHTLVIGIGLVTGEEKRRQVAGDTVQNSSAIEVLLVRTSLFVVVYLLLSLFYFGFSFDFNEIPRLANVTDLFVVWVPFVLGASFLGIFIGRIVPRTELVTLVVLLSSLPLMFSFGVIWPVEALPTWLDSIVQCVPASPAVKGFLLLNQMGAGLGDVTEIIAHQWFLVLFFGIAAWFFLSWQKKN